jgi:hypothetical protein
MKTRQFHFADPKFSRYNEREEPLSSWASDMGGFTYEVCTN